MKKKFKLQLNKIDIKENSNKVIYSKKLKLLKTKPF